MLNLQFDNDALRPLVQVIVAEVLREMEERNGQLEKLCYTEEEAAALLSVQPYVLRDARLRGEVKAATVGRRIMYTRRGLIDFLEAQAWQPS